MDCSQPGSPPIIVLVHKVDEISTFDIEEVLERFDGSTEEVTDGEPFSPTVDEVPEAGFEPPDPLDD